MRHIFFLLVVLLLCPPLSAAQAPSVGTEQDLAAAIFRFKTGPRGVMRWKECGSSLRGEAARARAGEYARYLWEEHESDSAFDPWIAAALVAQESSFNRCALSGEAMHLLRAHLLETQDRAPTERDISRLLRSSSYRHSVQVTRFDVGLAQFRWPGTAARRAGLTHPESLLDARTSVRLLAASMRSYRRACTTTQQYRGVYLVNRRDGTIRVLHYRIPCAEGYWVQHNSPSHFNYRYYSNVRHRYQDLVEMSRSVNPS